MASPNKSELVSTTIENRQSDLVDCVSENNALLQHLKKRGKMKTKSGGRNIFIPLTYQENSTYKRYSGYEELDVTPSDVITAAEWEWKQSAVAVSISGREMLQNSGKEAFLDLLESRLENAEYTMANNISADIYSNGSADNQIDGLQAIVADTNTNDVGGINGSTWSFWRNYSFDATTDGGAAVSSSNITSYMNDVYINCTRGADSPDLIVADNVFFKAYLESLQGIQRIGSSSEGQAGFQKLKYMNADVLLDGGYNGSAPASHMYFLNTKYLAFVTHSQRNFVALGDREPVNQDAIVKYIAWMGNLTCSNRFTQGVIKD